MFPLSHRRKADLESLEPRQLLAADLGVAAELRACVAEPTAPRAANQPLAALPAAEAQAAGQLRMFAPATYLPGTPVLVRVQVEDADGLIDRSLWDAVATLTTDDANVTLSQNEVTLVNGLGSAWVQINGSGPFNIVAQWNEMADTRHLEPSKQLGIPQISGVLTGDATTLNGIVRVTGDLTVPANHVLTIEPGTLILLDGVPQKPQVQLATRIIVAGTLNAQGTDDQPITFTATNTAEPWGEIDVNGGTANFNYTNITRAGNSSRGGHTNTGPALRLRAGGDLHLDHSNVTDINGKILLSSAGELTIADSLLSRAVMGPEITNTQLDFQDSWIIEMAGVYHHNGTVDDNDGIYLHEQAAGQTITLHRSVVANVQDDGIDTLGSTILVDDVIVRDVTDKTISVFNGEVTVLRGLLINGDIGIEAKGSGSSTADVHIDRTTIANVNAGVRAFDKDSPDPNVKITYDIVNSVIAVRPGGDPLYTDYDPADFHVNYSWVDEAWTPLGSGTGNVNGQPLFVDGPANDYRLAEGSPAIDAGDPNAPLDVDGTRADMGYYTFLREAGPNADFNGDGVVDAADIDLLCASLATGEFDDIFDLNGDGNVDQADLDYLIGSVLHTTYGDANLDGVFDSADLVFVFQEGQYEDGVPHNSGWATGDWDCDGDFTTSDLVVAFQTGNYVAGASKGR